MPTHRGRLGTTRLEGELLNDVDLQLILSHLTDMDACERAEVYAQMNGTVHIDVWQRHPVLRVHITDTGEDHYLDEDGRTDALDVRPLHPHIPVMHVKRETQAHMGFRFVSATKDDPFWNALTDQLSMNDDGELVLHPRLAGHEVILGNADNCDTKAQPAGLLPRPSQARQPPQLQTHRPHLPRSSHRPTLPMMDNQSQHTPAEIVVGLDIGTTKIACFIGQKNEFGKIELLGYGRSESVGVSRGVVANIDYTVASIKQAVQEAEQKVGAQIRLVNVGIAGQHIKSLQHRGLITRRTSNLKSARPTSKR